jgi:hypothetical protein
MPATLLFRRPTTRDFALVSGIGGFIAGVFLVILVALSRPFDEHRGGGSWTPTAADAVGTVQFLALAPVAWGLRGRMPASRTVRIAGVAVVAAAAGSAVLQILIFSGVVPPAGAVPPGAIAPYLILIWILIVSLIGHRTRTLPRPVTRAGVLIGAALPVGVVLILPGPVTPEPLRSVFIGAGVGVGVLAYLAIPIFPLLLATHVFKEET